MVDFWVFHVFLERVCTFCILGIWFPCLLDWSKSLRYLTFVNLRFFCLLNPSVFQRCVLKSQNFWCLSMYNYVTFKNIIYLEAILKDAEMCLWSLYFYYYQRIIFFFIFSSFLSGNSNLFVTKIAVLGFFWFIVTCYFFFLPF